MTLVELARHFSHLRETSIQNRGARVMAVQLWGGADEKEIARILADENAPGFSWCCYLFWLITDVFFTGNSPVPRTGSCQEVYEWAQKNGLTIERPVPGCGYVYVNDEGHAHHIGFVTMTGYAPQSEIAVPWVDGFAGNTSEDGLSSNGKGAFEHELKVQPSHIKYFRIPGA